jgi:hypothetical protein
MSITCFRRRTSDWRAGVGAGNCRRKGRGFEGGATAKGSAGATPTFRLCPQGLKTGPEAGPESVYAGGALGIWKMGGNLLFDG